MTHIRTTNFDALAASAPLDRQASVVRDGSGEGWEASIPDHAKRWLAPPRLTPISAMNDVARKVAAELVGKQFGRMTVLGVWADGNPKKNATWVCRCACGYYEGRKAKALRGPYADSLMCIACAKVEHLKAAGAKRNTRATREASSQALDRLSQQHGGQR